MVVWGTYLESIGVSQCLYYVVLPFWGFYYNVMVYNSLFDIIRLVLMRGHWTSGRKVRGGASGQACIQYFVSVLEIDTQVNISGRG